MLQLKFAFYHRASEVCVHAQQASLFDLTLAIGIATINSCTFAARTEE